MYIQLFEYHMFNQAVWFAIKKNCKISENGAVLFFLVEYCIRLNKSLPHNWSNLFVVLCYYSSQISNFQFPHFHWKLPLFFTYILFNRFICSPRKFRFFKQPMNLVDFCAIIPFLLDLVIGGLQVSYSCVFVFVYFGTLGIKMSKIGSCGKY